MLFKIHRKAVFSQCSLMKAIFHVICKANMETMFFNIGIAERIQRTIASRNKIENLTLISQLGIAEFQFLRQIITIEVRSKYRLNSLLSKTKKRKLCETSILCEVDFDAKQLQHIVEHNTSKYRDTQFESVKQD